jgi:transposase
MQTITTIGLDIAKSVFQVHGVDAAGEVVIRRQLKRSHVLAFFQKLPPCLVGIEACASSHHWSRGPEGHTRFVGLFLWALVHGLGLLLIDGQVEPDEDPKDIVRRVLQLAGTGLDDART